MFKALAYCNQRYVNSLKLVMARLSEEEPPGTDEGENNINDIESPDTKAKQNTSEVSEAEEINQPKKEAKRHGHFFK